MVAETCAGADDFIDIKLLQQRIGRGHVPRANGRSARDALDCCVQAVIGLRIWFRVRGSPKSNDERGSLNQLQHKLVNVLA